MDVGPGDFVECIDAEVPLGEPHDLSDGAVYQVASLHKHPDTDGDTICVVGGPAFGDEAIICGERAWFAGFDLRRFRPIYRRHEGAFDHLLTPIDERVLA